MQNRAECCRAAQPGFDPYSGHSDTGWFGSKLAHSVSHALNSVANQAKKGVTTLENSAVKVASIPVHVLPGKLGKAFEYVALPGNVVGRMGLSSAANSIRGAINTLQHPNIDNLVASAQQSIKNTGPLGMVGAGALGAMKAGLQGKNLESIAWAAAEGAAPDGIAQAIGAAEKIRHGGSIIDIALKQAQTAFLPGTAELVGFNSAIGALKSQASMSGLGEIRRTLNTEGAKRAFDTAIGTVAKVVKGNSNALGTRANGIPNIVLERGRSAISATNPQISHVLKAIALNPSLMAVDPHLLASQFGTHVSAIHDAMNRSSKSQLLPWRSMSPHAVNFIRRYAPQSPLMALRHLHTDTAGLDQTGMKYIVEKGDGPWAIAQKLVGNGNRWTELKAVNADKNPSIDKNVWVGEVLNLPASWQKPVSVSKPPSVALPSVPLPSIGPVPSTGIPVIATPSIDISPSIVQGKSILVAWSKTDGVNQAGLSDYGSNVADLSTSMGPRDTLELASFQNWNNKTLGSTLNTTGALDPATLTALQSWAEARATSALPSAVTAGGAAPPMPIGTASFPPVVIPEVTIGGTAPPAPPPGVPALPSGASPLPTVASKNAPTTATKVAAQKQGGGLAPVALGAVVGGLLFGVPGALVGAAGGAAIS